MKKSTKVSIIAVVTGVVLLIIGSIVTYGEAKSGVLHKFADKLSTSANINFFNVEEVGTEDFLKVDYSTPINRIVIDLGSEDVEIRTSSDGNTHIEYNSKKIKHTLKDKECIFEKEGNNGINISILGGVIKKSADLILYIPANNETIIDCDITSGDIEASGITLKEFNIDGRSCDVELYNVLADKFNINTRSGDIEFSNMDATSDIKISANSGDVEGDLKKNQNTYKITTDTNSGECNLSNTSFGTVTFDVSTTSGDIDVEFGNE